MEDRIAQLQRRSTEAHFWDEPEEAQATMQELSSLQSRVSAWRELASQVDELAELSAMAQAEGDESMIQEISSEAVHLQATLSEMHLRLMMSGEHDARDAILSVYAGAGGTESQDWAEMLLRMYLRWADRHGFAAEIVDQSEGEGAGLKSVTVGIKGPKAYGYLRSERGVHRLVRISPFDNAHRRHTSFALVEVIPDIANAIEIQISPDDLKLEVFGASGHGGQNVQKNATAVRLTHIPTGIVATCQSERSQVQNRERATAVLKSRLYDLELRRQEEERARLRGEHVTAGWGNQIRSYVLHPYRMVKDLRTGWQTGDPTAVLDGDIDPLIEAYLQHMVGKS